MSYAQRVDFGQRVAGSKAQFPDEFLTRSQVIPGRNVTFDYLTTVDGTGNKWDIRINALGGGTAIGGDGCCRRMMTGEVSLSNFAESAHYSSDARATANGILGAVENRRYYGDLAYADIHHNWGLTEGDAFLAHLIDIRTGVSSPFSLDSRPKVVGIDGNTVRIILTNVSGKVATKNGDDSVVLGLTEDSNIISVADSSDFIIGQTLVLDSYLPENTRVTALGSSQITVSKDALQSGSGLTAKVFYWRPNEDTTTCRSGTAANTTMIPRYRYTLMEYTD